MITVFNNLLNYKDVNIDLFETFRYVDIYAQESEDKKGSRQRLDF